MYLDVEYEPGGPTLTLLTYVYLSLKSLLHGGVPTATVRPFPPFR